MIFQRLISIGAMLAVSSTDDFLNEIIPQLPHPQVPGALPAMTRELAPPKRTLRPLDLVTIWGIGDFDDNFRCSNYYNPNSPWYNVFYGLYAMRSYKAGGDGWGYSNGNADFNEFLREIAATDYNYFTGAEFGCPPELMSFQVKDVTTESSDSGWDVATVSAVVPSGLHDPLQHHADVGNYIVFGIPDPTFLTNRTSYEQVPMVGQFYMRELSVKKGTPPVTLVWGTACPDTKPGQALRDTIMKALRPTYLSLGS